MIEGVECAEADIPGRQRGDEYARPKAERCWRPGCRGRPARRLGLACRSGPAALSAAIATKIGKRYAGSATSLLINLNISEVGIRQAENEATMTPAVMPALLCFERVWILWKARLYGPWAA